jgi:prepilin-type N-terminal cleavage/methylation domain-containing protein
MSTRTARTNPRSAGFTLVEILIVVVILGILASIVIPQFTNATDQSKAAAAASITRTIQTKILEDYATEGQYTDAIDDDWFVEGTLPNNPLAPDQTSPVVHYDNAATAAMSHPGTKTAAATGAFWYNPTNGRFRALVPDQGSPAQTLELYNKVNASDVAALGNTTD